MILQTRIDLNGLKDSFKAGDSSSILEVCHQLASRLGQIKSPTGIIAREIETNLKMKNQNGLVELLDKLDLEINSFPVPVSPNTKILKSVGATGLMCFSATSEFPTT